MRQILNTELKLCSKSGGSSATEAQDSSPSHKGRGERGRGAFAGVHSIYISSLVYCICVQQLHGVFNLRILRTLIVAKNLGKRKY